ncbi:hypothetical protein PR048_033263 [Dryococelus australis]|uniref:Uncharacterized protein n=1 Tax=Dryococelus australis TaxID=614101 RepID=A0ABQ9G127_9NEOP|nr:hypothetical protein PR048_033263 [Dryococelus australis]
MPLTRRCPEFLICLQRRAGNDGAHKPTTADNVYTDLQSENSGSIAKRNDTAPQISHRKPPNTAYFEPPRKTREYFAPAGHFQPNSFEQAEI